MNELEPLRALMTLDYTAGDPEMRSADFNSVAGVDAASIEFTPSEKGWVAAGELRGEKLCWDCQLIRQRVR